MILEAIVTTRNADGSTNVAPMGPQVASASVDFETFELRPFQSSNTFQNLCRTNQGVLHVTDDVMLFARAALNRVPQDLRFEPAEQVDVQLIPNACRWHEFEVDHVMTITERASMQCRCVVQRRGRDFFGFNRAMHAVIEASILASRIGFLPHEEIHQQMTRLGTIVEKTGGPNEREAFELLRSHTLTATARA